MTVRSARQESARQDQMETDRREVTVHSVRQEIVRREMTVRDVKMETDRQENLETDRQDRKVVIEMAAVKEKRTITRKISRAIAAVVIIMQVAETIGRTIKIVRENRETV